MIDSIINTQVQSHALLRRGFGTSVPFIVCVPQFYKGSPGSEEVLQLANLPPVIRKGGVDRRAGHCQGNLTAHNPLLT